MRTGRIVWISVMLVAAAYVAGPYRDKGSAVPTVPAAPGPLVRQVDQKTLLVLLAQGRRVIFVDAREPMEFKEEHIPGAMNLTLREVEKIDPSVFLESDIVVAYCLKDFRGFEVARALQRAGVKGVHTLDIVGLNGWKRSGLPTAGQNGLDEAGALAQLRRMARAAMLAEGVRP